MARYTYRVDLPAEQAECEANYARIMRLLKPAVADREVGLPDGRTLRLRVTERGPYTTTLAVAPEAAEQRQHWVMGPELTVRVYHDARMAEVVACDRQRRLAARYHYPNRQMFQPDEKSQWNRFLGEWLSHCLQHGHTASPPQVPSCEL